MQMPDHLHILTAAAGAATTAAGATRHCHQWHPATNSVGGASDSTKYTINTITTRMCSVTVQCIILVQYTLLIL